MGPPILQSFADSMQKTLHRAFSPFTGRQSPWSPVSWSSPGLASISGASIRAVTAVAEEALGCQTQTVVVAQCCGVEHKSLLEELDLLNIYFVLFQREEILDFILELNHFYCSIQSIGLKFIFEIIFLNYYFKQNAFIEQNN